MIGCLILSIASAATSCKKSLVAKEKPAVEKVVEEEE